MRPPPSPSSTVQITSVSSVPLTVAEKSKAFPATTSALSGEIVTTTDEGLAAWSCLVWTSAVSKRQCQHPPGVERSPGSPALADATAEYPSAERFVLLVPSDAAALPVRFASSVSLVRFFSAYPAKDGGAIFAAGPSAGAGASAGSSVPHQSQDKSVPVFSLRQPGTAAELLNCAARCPAALRVARASRLQHRR